MAALQRTSPCLSFRDWTSAGTIRVASPSRWGKRRTALIRSPSWDDFRSAINSLVDFSFLQPPHASKQSNRTKRVCTRIVELLRRMRDCPKRGQGLFDSACKSLFLSRIQESCPLFGQSPGRSPIAEQFAAGYGAEVLISVGVDAAAEEMHRAVAEQEVGSPGVKAVKHIRVEDREVGAGQVRGVAVAEDQGLVEVRIIVGRPGGRSVGGGGLGRHPGGTSSSRDGAGEGAGGMVAGALADDDGVAQAV